ncbi:hypothetical protein NKH73_32050, partial [Mesorhizobium sp. M0938]
MVFSTSWPMQNSLAVRKGEKIDKIVRPNAGSFVFRGIASFATRSTPKSHYARAFVSLARYSSSRIAG